ncbi:MAG: zf-HC2 domain-containing protein [Nocardioidaceae bacterium]
MTCRELVELVTAYLEGALAEPDRERFEAHLRECEGCDRYLEQMRHTLAVLGGLAERTLPPGSRQQLLAAFASWREPDA